MKEGREEKGKEGKEDGKKQEGKRKGGRGKGKRGNEGEERIRIRKKGSTNYEKGEIYTYNARFIMRCTCSRHMRKCLEEPEAG